MKYIKNLFFIILLLLIDQLTKFYFFGKSIFLFKYFSFNYIENTGVTFGLFQGNNLFFIIFSLIIIGLVFYFYKKYDKYNIAWNFILAGAFGNLLDRIIHGFVVDFIDLGFWYVFNLADSFIIIGIGLLLFYFIKEKN